VLSSLVVVVDTKMQFILGNLSMFPIRGTGLNCPYFSRFNLHLARRQKGCLSSTKCGLEIAGALSHRDLAQMKDLGIRGDPR